MADGMPPAADAAALHERDFHAWGLAQAAALRTSPRPDATLDYENLAEEIEALALREVREVWSRMGTIIEHLLKLERSPAGTPRAGWRATVRRTRSDLERVLETSPSLRRHLRDRLGREHEIAAKEVVSTMHEHGKDPSPVQARLDAGGYTPEQVLGDWWPAPPPPAG